MRIQVSSRISGLEDRELVEELLLNTLFIFLDQESMLNNQNLITSIFSVLYLALGL